MGYQIPTGAAIITREPNGDEVARWIGTEPADGEQLQVNEFIVAHYARELADALLDGRESELEYRKAAYRRVRDDAARTQRVYDAMWKNGRFAGWVIRDSDLAA